MIHIVIAAVTTNYRRSQAVARIADRTDHSRLSSNQRLMLNSISSCFRDTRSNHIGVTNLTFHGVKTVFHITYTVLAGT